MSKKIIFDKSAYRDLCQSIYVPIFYQPWWLDVVAGDQWDVMLYREDPNVVAINTFFLKQKGPFMHITMPPLTKFAGPFFLGQFSQRKRQRILKAFENALPEVSGFQQTFHYTVLNWLPYFWKGYKQTVNYSFVLNDIRDIERTYSNVVADYRNNKMAKAAERVKINYDLNHAELLKLMEAPFIRQGIRMPVEKTLIHRIVETCEKKGRGRSLYAVDPEGNIHSAIFMIWDQRMTYLLLAGENPEFRSSGAGIYTTWAGIKYASEEIGSQTFDFLGGMSQSLERTRQQFGATPVPYFYLSRWKGLARVFREIRWLIKGY